MGGIADQCGRITGEILRQRTDGEVEAAAPPCPIFRNPVHLTEAAVDAGVAPCPPTPNTSPVGSTTVPTATTTTVAPATIATIATTLPVPPNLDANVAVSETLTDDADAVATAVDVSVTYTTDGAAQVSVSATGSSSWDETFQCFLDDDPNEATGDTAAVRYNFAYTASSSTQAAAGPDGSLTATLPYSVDGAITFVLAKPFVAECAHLNGEPAPDSGRFPGSGEISVTVASDRSVSVSTAWTGRFGEVRGSGSAGG